MYRFLPILLIQEYIISVLSIYANEIELTAYLVIIGLTYKWEAPFLNFDHFDANSRAREHEGNKPKK